MSISASAVLSLQTRINNERSRRGLSSAGFTGGVTSGSNIRAPHINELRSYTETLNTMGSVSFGWSGNVAAGADITDALSQISSYCTTLEGEALQSWHTLSVASSAMADSQVVGPNGGYDMWAIWDTPVAARPIGNIRWRVSHSGETDGPTMWKMVNLFFVANGYTPASFSTAIQQYQGVWNIWRHHTVDGYDWAVGKGNFDTWVGSVNDTTTGAASDALAISYTQTPYKTNTKTGLGAQQDWNHTHGMISANWQGFGSYHCAENHWYYTQKTVPEGYNRIFLHYNTWATGNNALINSGIEIQAYY